MAADVSTHPSTRQELADIAASWMKYWQGGDLEESGTLHDPGFIDRTPSERGTDGAAFRSGIEQLYAAFPDFRARAEFMAIDVETQIVTIRWTATGTHSGAFMGHPPSGRTISFEGIDVIRCAVGKVVERWGEWNGKEIADAIAAG